VLVLGTIGTGVAYMLFFVILRGAGASRSILVTYLVPSAALLYGVLLLGEELRPVAVAGLALILGGVALGARRGGVASPA
jgi:drug/metabolite transporter (DMT)-like permease